MQGIPIPESVRLMMQREKEEPDNNPGSYSAITRRKWRRGIRNGS